MNICSVFSSCSPFSASEYKREPSSAFHLWPLFRVGADRHGRGVMVLGEQSGATKIHGMPGCTRQKASPRQPRRSVYAPFHSMFRSACKMGIWVYYRAHGTERSDRVGAGAHRTESGFYAGRCSSVVVQLLICAREREGWAVVQPRDTWKMWEEREDGMGLDCEDGPKEGSMARARPFESIHPERPPPILLSPRSLSRPPAPRRILV
ncbi:hypothetical protein OF83DRAFT_131248 [Amylostereum chailletii]|nr:hypothetical protein OF83DRAFT_131248 [Amylostereum chailletii]